MDHGLDLDCGLRYVLDFGVNDDHFQPELPDLLEGNVGREQLDRRVEVVNCKTNAHTVFCLTVRSQH